MTALNVILLPDWLLYYCILLSQPTSSKCVYICKVDGRLICIFGNQPQAASYGWELASLLGFTFAWRFPYQLDHRLVQSPLQNKVHGCLKNVWNHEGDGEIIFFLPWLLFVDMGFLRNDQAIRSVVLSRTISFYLPLIVAVVTRCILPPCCFHGD